MIRRVRESLGSETRVALRGAREGDTELMTKKRVLGFKPALGISQVDDEHSARVRDCK